MNTTTTIKETNLSELLDVICGLMGEEREKVTSKVRKRNLVDVRQVFCYVCRKTTRHSFEAIAKTINRDHSSAIHSAQTLEDVMTFDKSLQSRVNAIMFEVTRGANIEISKVKFTETNS